MLDTEKNIDPEAAHRSRAPHRWLIFFSFLIGLSILFLLPDMLITLDRDDTSFIPVGLYLKASLLASIFLINYYIIIPRTLLQRSRPTGFLLINTGLAILSLLCLYLIWHQLEPGAKPPIGAHAPTEPIGIPPGLPPSEPGQDRFTPPDAHNRTLVVLARDFIIIVLTIGFSASLRLISYRKEVDHTRREMESLRRDMELVQLRNQLNPHFLFNTLNSIYALVDIDRDKAKEATHTLSKLLRHMLYECKGIVTTRQECDFLASYISLMKLRLAPDFPLKVSLDSGTAPYLRIQPLLFINIIENAFKYGSRVSDRRGIDIQLKAEGNIVKCQCTNTYDSESTSLTSTEKSSGIGLDNLRRRLELRYPKRHSFNITDTGSEYTVFLSIDTSEPQPEP